MKKPVGEARRGSPAGFFFAEPGANLESSAKSSVLTLGNEEIEQQPSE